MICRIYNRLWHLVKVWCSDMTSYITFIESFWYSKKKIFLIDTLTIRIFIGCVYFSYIKIVFCFQVPFSPFSCLVSYISFCATINNCRWKKLFLILGFLHAGPVCLRCIDVAEITECITNTAECGDNEVTKEIPLSSTFHHWCKHKYMFMKHVGRDRTSHMIRLCRDNKYKWAK